MTPFWTVSLFWLAVLVCIAIALAFVLPPLLRARTGRGVTGRRDVNIAVYRDQLREIEADRASGLLSDAQFESARRELEARLADDALGQGDPATTVRAGSRAPGYALAAVLPAAAIGLYLWTGEPASLAGRSAAQPVSAEAGMPAEHDFGQLVRQAEEKTRAHPDDGEAWALLARSYAFVERWPEAARAYEHAVRLLPGDASVLSGYAEARAIANNRVLTDEMMALVQRALDIDPDDATALELAAIRAYQAGDFVSASGYFERLHAVLPAESAFAKEVLAAQQEAERLALPGGAESARAAGAPAADAQPAASAAGARIRGRVELAPALASRLVQTDVLFVFARSGAGGPPVAAIRASAGQLPFEFELDDGAAMTPGNALSQHKQVTLVARLSRSGDPVGRSGDLEGRAVDVAVGSGDVTVVIDRILP